MPGAIRSICKVYAAGLTRLRITGPDRLRSRKFLGLELLLFHGAFLLETNVPGQGLFQNVGRMAATLAGAFNVVQQGRTIVGVSTFFDDDAGTLTGSQTTQISQ